MDKRFLAFGVLYGIAVLASLNAPNGWGLFSWLGLSLIVSCTNYICIAIEFNGEKNDF